MHTPRRSTRPLVLAAVLATVGACSEPTTPTVSVVVPDGASAAAGPNAVGKVKIKTFQLSANTIRIDGPAISAQVSIGNSGSQMTGVSIRGEIVQASATRQAVNQLVNCSGDMQMGHLFNGTCEMTFNASASNSAPGDGTLAAGQATFTLHVIQTIATVETELATKSVDVNLVATPSITALTIAPTTLTIEGPAANYSATLQNPANSLQGVALQGWVVQGSTRRAAGGTLVTCGASAGVLAPGPCTMSSLATASNNGVFTPAFVPGPATFVLYLMQSNGGASTIFDSAMVAVTLTKPIISLLTLTSPAVEINGALDNYTAKIVNEGVPLSDVLLQGDLVQIQPDGAGGTVEVTVAAGGTLVTCGGAPGVLPTGTCNVDFGIVASTSSSGNGTLQPGPATFVLHLYKSPPNAAQYEWDRWTVAVGLTSPAPTLTSVVPTSTNVIINPPIGMATSYVATIDNPGVARSIVVLQAEIKQGTTVRAAGGSNVTCGGNIALGLLPTGTCTQTRPISSYNSNGGSGTLVPGPATLEVTLSWFNGATTTVLDTKSVDITLVAGVTITELTLQETDVLAGGSTNYTVTFNNPFATTLTGMSIQGYLDQGSITNYAAGGSDLTCSGQTAGQLAPGTCTMSFTLFSSNAFSSPLWLTGPATFRLQLKQNSVVLDEKSVPLNFYRLQ